MLLFYINQVNTIKIIITHMEPDYNEAKPVEHHQPNLLSLQAKPRRIKKDNRIKIDISKTQYPLLRNVSLNELGWKIWTREQSKEEINVYWVDTYVPEEHIKRMKTYQRINHFPASENLGKKNLLTANLNRMKKLVPNQYAFYPQTFNFPTEAEQFEKFSKSKQDQYIIVKPNCDSQGRGIFLTKMADLNIKQEMVVQEYIQSPLLIEGMKFDLRIYVLLKSVFPLKIYIYHEGLSRLATCSYEKPSSNNKKNMRMHLTNYAINKFSPNFVFNKSQEEDHIGHKRSYTATMKAIEKLGCDINILQTEIDKVIVKTIMSAYQHLQKKYKELRDIKQESESICFEILGFDILIKQDFVPLLLQVNHSPSFSTDSPLDLAIKKCLILDTLNILNLNHQDKITYLKNKSDHDPMFTFLHTSRNHRSVHIESEEIGAFRKIYPLETSAENQQINKLYEQIFKSCKIQKIVKPIKYVIQKKDSVQNKVQIQKALVSNLNIEQQQKFFAFYSVINNFKVNRFKPSKIQKSQSTASQNPVLKPQKQNIFQSDIDSQSMRKQELLSYERKIRKDKEKQKKKCIFPMTLNNISIKLDQKYMLPKREVKSNSAHYYSPQHGYFRVNPLPNKIPQWTQSQRTKTKEKGNQTADHENRQLQNYQLFKKNHLAVLNTTQLTGFSHITDDNAYSLQLKQKLERMQFVRLKIQKTKKMDKTGFIIIKNKSAQKKASQYLVHHDDKIA